MPNPVYLDGPLHGAVHEVTEEAIEQGIYRYGPDVVYTFTVVEMFGFRLPVASVANGIPTHQLLFDNLASESTKRAAGR
jgi:hypothetical protein